MKQKKINVTLEQVKVVDIMLDLENLENYMSKFLALKNHERHTDEILEVRGIDDSNSVHVVMLGPDEDDDEKEYVERCKDYIEQFGKIESCEVQEAWLIDRHEMRSQAEYDDWYIM